MYNEEMQDRGVTAMQGVGLSMNRVIYPITDTMTPDALVSTTEDGPFWCGDLAPSDLSRLQSVATQLKRTLVITSQTTNKSFQVSV